MLRGIKVSKLVAEKVTNTDILRYVYRKIKIFVLLGLLMLYFIFINFIYKYGYAIINITKKDRL